MNPANFPGLSRISEYSPKSISRGKTSSPIISVAKAAIAVAIPETRCYTSNNYC